MRYLALLWFCLSIVYGMERGPCLDDDALLFFSKRYEVCFQTFLRAMNGRTTYQEAAEILRPHMDLFEEIYRDPSPLHLRYLFHFRQTVFDECQKIENICDLEKQKPENERCAEYPFLDEMEGSLILLKTSIKAHMRNPNKFKIEHLGVHSRSCLRTLGILPKTDPFVLCPLVPKVVHKLLFLSYVGRIFLVIPEMVATKSIPSKGGVSPLGEPLMDRVSFLEDGYIRLPEDADKPFVEVFERIQRECGANGGYVTVLKYIDAMMPDICFVETAAPVIDGNAENLTQNPLLVALCQSMMAAKKQESDPE